VGALELVSLGLGWAWAKAGSGMARLRPRGGVVGTVAMLLAVALFYGMSGSFDLAGVETALVAGRMNHHVSVAALGLLLFGIVGKMVTHLLPILAGHRSEGTVWIGCLVVSAQASMLGVLLRATGWFFLLTDEWTTVLWVAAVLAMTLGNVAALIQKDIVRLLAFSSLAHVGYLLVGVVAGGHSGRAAVLFFLPGYVVAACGAFILAAGRSRSGDGTRCSHQKDTFSDLVLSLFVLSLAGLPPAAGFIGKFYLLSAAVQGRDLSLAVIGAFNILVNIYYCVRLVVTLHTRVPGAKPLSRPVGILLKLPLAIASGVVLLLGVLPEPWLSLARRAGLEFF
ncbi:MAG: proton-conducting transporter membrane subunit, partial [Acidobacteriota bacterium]